MLLKKTMGIILLALNVGGLGYLVFLALMTLRDIYLSKKQLVSVQETPASQAKPTISNDDIISDEDDLLKNMDLSDLDNLDLDDFK